MGNVRDNYRGIETGNLPKTLRDAVAVCRGLGIPNLWIDSLCIIQDDRDDWLRESPQMLEIYGNPYLTIYASASDSCKLGFLGTQRYADPQWQRRIKTTAPEELSCPGKEFFIRARGEDGKPPHPPASVLSKRAWCLQERVLSKRRLYFDSNEMTWECNTRRMCECGHLMGRWIDDDDENFLNVKKALRLMLESYNHHQGDYNPFSDWKSLVENYSTMMLTND